MKHSNVQKKVGDFMGGKVLDLPEFRIYDQGVNDGISQGRAEGISQGRVEGISQGRAEGEKERQQLADENSRLKAEIESLRKNHF
ncbi:MAG: hypothetical protein IK152_08455 [Lachnospiraceae bacterium]|nr:hypothetical protein [Lachnospiraceae bacterium]